MKCPFCNHDNLSGSETCMNCEQDLTYLDGPSRKKTIMQNPLKKLPLREAVCINENASVYDAVKKMNAIKAGSVLVENLAGEVKGILTEWDILSKTSGNGAGLKKMRVSQIMTSPIETLPEDSTLALALHQMSVKRFRHIPLLRNNNKPVVLSSRDLLKYIAKHLGKSR